MITDLKQHAENILFVKDNFKILNDSILALHQLYTSHTGIAASDINDKDIMLETGKAISPIKAAHCLLETSRTTAFLRGIYNAILRLQKDFPDEKINILYAGSGPYATLLTPLTTQFSSSEIGIYMLEINAISLTAVQNLFTKLGITEYIEAFICADAATYQLPDNKTIHLIISETMKEGLQKEPQVSIMLNLVPQMAAKTIFIPEEISVSLKLIFGGEELQSFFEGGKPPERIDLGEIYTIGRTKCEKHQPLTISIPENTGRFTDLSLFTDIKVYEDEFLTTYNCSLNLPVKIANITAHSEKKLTLKYVIDQVPGFRLNWHD